jgi:hypothetical protein
MMTIENLKTGDAALERKIRAGYKKVHAMQGRRRRIADDLHRLTIVAAFGKRWRIRLPGGNRACHLNDKPGTLHEQLEAIELFLSNPFRHIDREAAWDLARRLVMPHARRAT